VYNNNLTLVPMTELLPIVSKFEKKEMKKACSGPRPETLSLIRVFARIYDCDAAGNGQWKNFWLN